MIPFKSWRLRESAFRKRHNAYEIAALCFLLIVISVQLFFSVRRESQTWDEADHIFAGYRSWTHGDYGLNPGQGYSDRKMGQREQAQTCYQKALDLAKTIEPEFQIRSVPGIEQKLQSML